MNEKKSFFFQPLLKRFWGRMVFRYAGRNICSRNTIRVRRFYNIIGRIYDRLYTEQIADYQQAAAHLVDSYIHVEDRILDLGCGTGILTQLAATKSKLIVGLDLSLGMIQPAKKKNHGSRHIHFIVGDCRYLPLRISFDKIISSFMMVTLNRADQKLALQQIFPLLGAEGEAIFLTANEKISSQWLTDEEWNQLGKISGFQEIECEDIFDFFRIVRMCKRQESIQTENPTESVASAIGEP
ncbi:MAG: class I SAM-dependent methyltransferase [Candidatus Omnitrophota bacterium]|jgi:ubiquinone/menaquinone biosynthesis C-methylase UbiE|nr:MAG: class I SAM-dependent methyltransferase [Candidatus Omnitrophota bacterium]